MRLRKSHMMVDWYSFTTEDENGCPEEIISVKTLAKAKKIIDTLQKDYENLSTSQSEGTELKFKNNPCPDCNGTKYVWDDYHKEHYICMTCKGTGKARL